MVHKPLGNNELIVNIVTKKYSINMLQIYSRITENESAIMQH